MKQESLASLQEKLQEAIAYADDCCKETATLADLQNAFSYFNDRIRYVNDQMNSLWTSLYEHTSQGHLPKLAGAAQMEKALKALGLDGDYEVQKRVIYASDGSPKEQWFGIKAKE